jgi:hypothetical protein
VNKSTCEAVRVARWGGRGGHAEDENGEEVARGRALLGRTEGAIEEITH